MFPKASSHITAILTALNQLSFYYDKCLIDKACYEYDLFAYLFPNINDQKEVLDISTAHQLETLEKTSNGFGKKIIQDYLNSKRSYKND